MQDQLQPRWGPSCGALHSAAAQIGVDSIAGARGRSAGAPRVVGSSDGREPPPAKCASPARWRCRPTPGPEFEGSARSLPVSGRWSGGREHLTSRRRAGPAYPVRGAWRGPHSSNLEHCRGAPTMQGAGRRVRNWHLGYNLVGQLTAAGHQVRGSVRSLRDPSRTDHLKSARRGRAGRGRSRPAGVAACGDGWHRRRLPHGCRVCDLRAGQGARDPRRQHRWCRGCRAGRARCARTQSCPHLVDRHAADDPARCSSVDGGAVVDRPEGAVSQGQDAGRAAGLEVARESACTW